MNLLLVDDEILALEMLEEAVREAIPDGKCNCFDSATKAMEFAASNTIDIAFLDINMRIMNGLEMAKALMEINPKINIIFCTGYEEYALDAFKLYSSGYLLKPISEEKILEVMEHLRFPIEETKRVHFHCFGNFEAYCDGKPIQFSLSRTKELLAYLVDRDGAECRIGEIVANLFEDDNKQEYYKKLRQDLISVFTELDIMECLNVFHGGLGVNREAVSCDYFDYKDGKLDITPTEYMSQYSFAEYTLALLTQEDF